MEGDMLLVGIGCNVLSAPTVNAASNSATASSLVRPATCLAQHSAALAEAAATLRQLNEQKRKQQEVAAGTAEGSMMHSVEAGHANADDPAGVSIFATLTAGDFHKELGVEICDNLYDWLASGSDSAALVVQDFERNMDFSAQRLRDVADPAKSSVLPVGLNPDGTLKVSSTVTFQFYFISRDSSAYVTV